MSGAVDVCPGAPSTPQATLGGSSCGSSVPRLCNGGRWPVSPEGATAESRTTPPLPAAPYQPQLAVRPIPHRSGRLRLLGGQSQPPVCATHAGRDLSTISRGLCGHLGVYATALPPGLERG